jgi:SAM-dependent methyltransferase
VPDPIFADQRLANLYDVLGDDKRHDLDAYIEIVSELQATTVLDAGCGTGTLACQLAQRGVTVFGLDPAAASLVVARRKAGASKVTWIHAQAANAPELAVDLALMTGNVAQVFVTDAQWRETLVAMQCAVRVDGWLVFETRDPAIRGWERWTREETYREVALQGGETVTTWTELVDVEGPLVSFRHVFQFSSDGLEVASLSTLRFRTRAEITAQLLQAGFRTHDVRDAPDRPGLEFVFVAQRHST